MATQRQLVQKTEPRTQRIEGPRIPNLGALSQTIQARVSVQGSITKLSFPDGQIKKVLHVDLNGSSAGPGNLRFDQNDVRGLFIDLIGLRAWLQADADGLHDDRLVPGYQVYRDQPQTVNESGSVSSTISLGFDESVGVMGEDLTGSVGASQSISSSHSHSLQDFTFLNRSTGQIVHHEIPMEQLKDGEEYEGPASLVNEFQSPFVGARLRELPNLAKANVPIPSQAVWINDRNSDLVDRAQLSVELTARYRGIAATNNGFTISSQVVDRPVVFRFGFPIDFTIVDGDD